MGYGWHPYCEKAGNGFDFVVLFESGNLQTELEYASKSLQNNGYRI